MTQNNIKSSQKNPSIRQPSLRSLPSLSRLFRAWCDSARSPGGLNVFARQAVFAAAFGFGTMTAVMATDFSTERNDFTPQQTLTAASDITENQMSGVKSEAPYSPASTAPLLPLVEETGRGSSAVVRPEENINNTQLKELAAMFPGKTESELRYCESLMQEGFSPLLHISDEVVFTQTSPEVALTDLYGWSELTYDFVIALVENCTNLERLDLGHCVQITDGGLGAFGRAKRGSRLQRVNLEFCNRITDFGVANLAKHCPLLEMLDFGCCNWITDAAVIAIAQNCPYVRCLNLYGCYLITDLAVIALAQCQHLQELRLWHCKNITNTGIDAIKQHCSNLTNIGNYGISITQDHNPRTIN